MTRPGEPADPAEAADAADRADPAPADPADPADPVAAGRARIHALDAELLELVAERVRVARAIGRAKGEAGGGKLDPGREAAVVRGAVERGRELGLPEEPVRDIFWSLIGLCRRVQVEDGA